MDKPQTTKKGFVVAKRCDECGAKTSVAVDHGEVCLVKCSICGKEYVFYCKT